MAPHAGAGDRGDRQPEPHARPRSPIPIRRAAPVATAAAVAALTAPVGYGKLVVMSSNFAGQEFVLDTAAVVIGRTDENDIVINHRSIAAPRQDRARDRAGPTHRRSAVANGVRVNGEEYGKVELRKGDLVDLGHVRLRFVAPGEDFIFDATRGRRRPRRGGGKRACRSCSRVLVLAGGAAVFLVTRRSKKTTGRQDRQQWF